VDWKLLATVFATIFVAELGDKTQLATLLYASDERASRWVVFAGASAALIATSAVGVLAGSFVSQWISARLLTRVAGIGFIAIGVWTLLARD
jgi:putative Ca2+/H+ antiporter (TMEM165/GDT1 family)